MGVCQVDEVRSQKECQMESDVQFTVSDVIVPKEDVKVITSAGTSYLGKNLCVYFSIPETSKIVTLSNKSNHNHTPKNTMIVKKKGTNNVTTTTTTMKEEEEEEEEEATLSENVVGIELGIAVINPNVLLKNGPCSVSHVVWEQVSR